MKLVVEHSLLRGKIIPPSSKSYAHRLLLAALLSKERVTISNITFNNDVYETIEVIKQFGKHIEINDDKVTLSGQIHSVDKLEFTIFESASTLRFIIPVALVFSSYVLIHMSERLSKRGIKDYVDAFKDKNIQFKFIDNDVEIIGRLKPGTYEVNANSSSQYISGLLFALPLLDKSSLLSVKTPLVSEDYVSMTLDVLNRSKIHILKNNNVYEIKGNQQYILSDEVVELDYSNASYLSSFNLIGGDVDVIGLTNNTLQGDKIYLKHFEALKNGFVTIDIKNCIDLAPMLYAVCSLYNGARFINTNRLSIKESDRNKVMQMELKKFGVKVTILDNEVIIDNHNIHKPSLPLDSHCDHRIAMSLIVLLLKYGGEINNIEAINKSYPNFIKDIQKLEGKVFIYD